eukprot:6204027-Pleurochrysis_carterae.AAC.3
MHTAMGPLRAASYERSLYAQVGITRMIAASHERLSPHALRVKLFAEKACHRGICHKLASKRHAAVSLLSQKNAMKFTLSAGGSCKCVQNTEAFN